VNAVMNLRAPETSGQFLKEEPNPSRVSQSKVCTDLRHYLRTPDGWRLLGCYAV
jgi:hypothetical protein